MVEENFQLASLLYILPVKPDGRRFEEQLYFRKGIHPAHLLFRNFLISCAHFRNVAHIVRKFLCCLNPLMLFDFPPLSQEITDNLRSHNVLQWLSLCSENLKSFVFISRNSNPYSMKWMWIHRPAQAHFTEIDRWITQCKHVLLGQVRYDGSDKMPWTADFRMLCRSGVRRGCKVGELII